MKVEFYVDINTSDSIITIPDEELNGMNKEEIEEYINDHLEEWRGTIVCNWREEK